MNSLARYIIIGLVIAIIAFLVWYFSSIVVYIIIAGVLSLIGSPIVDFLGKIKFRNFKLPIWLRSLLTLIFIWFLFVMFFRVFIPIISNQANELSSVNVDEFLTSLEAPINWIEERYEQYDLGGDEQPSFQEYISQKISSVLNFSIVTNIFSSLASVLGNLFIAVFSISFITFFLLRERGMLSEAIVLLSPQRHEENIRRALKSIKHLLSRYFIGILLQLTGILVLNTIGMTIIGLGFKQSLLIGLVAAVFNVIPYLGPIIGTTVGLLLGVAFNIDLEIMEILPISFYMLIVFLSLQLADNILFQPLIFSSSVNAHPLEIFLVILIAGKIAGVGGMILAIPSYTIIRVFAKEFFNNLRVVKKLTEKI